MMIKLACLALSTTIVAAIPNNWVMAKPLKPQSHETKNDVSANITRAREVTAQARWFPAKLPKKTCDIKTATFTGALDGYTENMFDYLNGLAESEVSDIESGSQAAASVCAGIWETAGALSPSIYALNNILADLATDCPSFWGAGTPAISLGVTVNVAVGAATTGGEIGLAMDSKGNQYCYAGYCSGAGIPPTLSATVGAALTWWSDIGNIPGTIQYAEGGFDVGTIVKYTTGITLGLGAGVTAFFDETGTEDDYKKCSSYFGTGWEPGTCPVKGLGIGAEIGVSPTISLPASVGIGECYTGVCFNKNSYTSTCGNAFPGEAPFILKAHEALPAPPAKTTVDLRARAINTTGYPRVADMRKKASH